MSAETTRRALLGGIGIAGALAVAPIAKAAPHAADPAKWSRVHAAYLAAEKAVEAHWLNVEEPLVDELKRRAPWPGRSFAVPAKDGSCLQFAWDPDCPDEYEECGRSIRLAARAHRAAWSANQELAAALNKDAVDAEGDRLGAVHLHAEDRLFGTPAPDAAAVLVKLRRLWADDRDVVALYQDLVLADMTRLAGGEGC